MKVIFIPDYRKENPYQTNLSNSLSKQEVFVCFSDDSFFSTIKAIIRYWKPDILHIHWPHSLLISNNKFVTINKFMTIIKSTCFISELLLSKIFRIKIVWTVHNILGHENDVRSLELLFMKIFAILCDRLIVHCPSAKEEVKRIYFKDKKEEKCKNLIVSIPHGNYQYNNSITNLQARDRLNLDTTDTIFLYFGQIRPYKGITELIREFKRLDNNAKLLIVGKPFNDEIASNILNNCKDNSNIKNILKFIPDDEIQIYMNAADVIVLPFKDVLTSGSIILSMSFGKPVIAPKIGCIADIIEEKGGFLYTENKLFDVMQHVLNMDKKILTDVGKHNLELTKKYDWDEIAKKTYNIYQDLKN